jgi:hypothetical protein
MSDPGDAERLLDEVEKAMWGDPPERLAHAEQIIACALFLRAATKSNTAGYLVARVHARNAGLMTGDLTMDPPEFTDLGKIALAVLR